MHKLILKACKFTVYFDNGISFYTDEFFIFQVLLVYKIYIVLFVRFNMVIFVIGNFDMFDLARHFHNKKT